MSSTVVYWDFDVDEEYLSPRQEIRLLIDRLDYDQIMCVLKLCRKFDDDNEEFDFYYGL